VRGGDLRVFYIRRGCGEAIAAVFLMERREPPRRDAEPRAENDRVARD
jgi:hypothetical protein